MKAKISTCLSCTSKRRNKNFFLGSFEELYLIKYDLNHVNYNKNKYLDFNTLILARTVPPDVLRLQFENQEIKPFSR